MKNFFLGGGQILQPEQARKTSFEPVYLSLYSASTFNLSPEGLGRALPRGVWIFVTIEPFPLDQFAPEAGAEIYELVSTNQSIRLIEHYWQENPRSWLTDQIAEYTDGEWILLKNRDSHIRHSDLRGINVRCITSDTEIHIVDHYYKALWHALEEQLSFNCDWKFSLVNPGNCNIQNNSCDGYFGFLINGSVDIGVGWYAHSTDRTLVLKPTFAINMGNLYLYGLAHQQIPWWQVFTITFSRQAWFGILGLLVAFTLTSIMIESGHVGDRIFTILPMACNQSRHESAWRPYGFLLSFTAWVFIAFFCTALTSSFSTRPNFPFSTLEEFSDSHWTLGTFQNVHEDHFFPTPELKRLKEKKKPLSFPWNELIERLANGSTAILGESDDERSFGEELTVEDFPRLMKIFQLPVTSWTTFFISRKFRFARRVDLALLKMQEVGILRRLKREWLDVPFYKGGVSGTAVIHESISLNMLWLPYLILSSGMIASLFILFGEIVHMKWVATKESREENVRISVGDTTASG